MGDERTSASAGSDAADEWLAGGSDRRQEAVRVVLCDLYDVVGAVRGGVVGGVAGGISCAAGHEPVLYPHDSYLSLRTNCVSV